MEKIAIGVVMWLGFNVLVFALMCRKAKWKELSND